MNREGKCSWGKGTNTYHSLEGFIQVQFCGLNGCFSNLKMTFALYLCLQYFVGALEKVTKLHIYQGVAFLLKLNTAALSPEHQLVREGEKGREGEEGKGREEEGGRKKEGESE